MSRRVLALSGAWAYPRRIMRDFVREPQWRLVALRGDVRASAAAGFGCSARAGMRFGVREQCTVVTAMPADLRVYHLAHCGRYYVPTTSTSTPCLRTAAPTRLERSRADLSARRLQPGSSAHALIASRDRVS